MNAIGRGWKWLAVGLFLWNSIVTSADDLSLLAASVTPVDSVLEKLRQNRAELTSQIADITSQEKKESTANSETLLLLRSIDALYAQQQTLLEQRLQLETQAKRAEKDLKSLDEFEPEEPRPYSFLLLESLKDQEAAEEDREKAIETDMKSAKQLLRSAHDELDEAEGDHQKLLAKKSNKEKENLKDAEKALRHAELAVKRARAKISVKQTEIEVHQNRLDICRSKQQQLAKKIKVINKDVSFTTRDRDRQLEKLAGKEAELKRRHREIELRLQQIEISKLSVADKKQPAEKEEEKDDEKNIATKEKRETPSAANKRLPTLPATDGEAHQRRVAAEAAQAELVLLDQQIENISELRRVWKRRFELTQGKTERKDLKRWLEDVEKFRSQIKDLTFSIEHRRDSVRDDQIAIANAVGESERSEATRWKEAWHFSLQEFRDLCEKSLDDNKSTERMLNRFRSELKTKIKETTTLLGLNVGETLQNVLNYEVAEADDETVTIGKVLILVIAIFAGLVLAYVISRIISHRFLRSWGLHQGTVAAWKSILFYAMCVAFGVMAFRLLHIPLGAFAFLGGAAAIALGFGSQDIMNNFMSGIILLTEQPIRVGDVIELDDIQGVVTHIGLRSTRVLTVSNHEMILANSTLLEERVTNLTLSDDFLKAFVMIELDRSVKVKQAKSKMLELTFAHPQVIKTMRPFVLIKAVDCYSITFEVHFWIQHQGFIKFAMVQSEVLEAITEHFENPDDSDDEDSNLDTATESETEDAAAKPSSNANAAKAVAKAALMKNAGNIPEKLLRSQIHKKGGGSSSSPDTTNSLGKT